MTRLTIILAGILVVAASASSSQEVPGTPLKNLAPDQVVRQIHHCWREWVLTMASGEQRRYPEFNLRFKTDGGPTGPEPGKPVLLPAGMRGDRGQVIFSGLDDLHRFLVERCDGGGR